MAETYTQTSTGATFNVGCSGASAASLATVGRTATIGGSGATAMVGDWAFGESCAAHAFVLPAPGVANWDGTWTVVLDISAVDAGDILTGVYVCDWDGSTTYVTAGSNTSPGHSRGVTATGGSELSVNVTVTSYTLQSTSTSQPFIVLTWNNNDAHGGAGSTVTSGQTITAPYTLAADPTLACDTVAFNVTGTAADLEIGYAVDAVTDAVNVSGTAANLEQGYKIDAATAVFTVADPVDARLKLTKSGDAGTVVVTGTAADLIYTAPAVIAADTTAFNVTGTAASLEVGYAIDADTAAVSVTGTDADLTESGLAVVACASSTGVLFDEFVQTADSSAYQIYSGGADGVGQSWQSDGSPQELTGVCFRLKKTGSPTGTIDVSVYAHSGTYGTSSVPTGAALVASVGFNANTLTTDYADYFFALTGWTPAASTSYVVVVERNTFVGDGGNFVSIVREDGAEATHGGNSARYVGSWLSSDTNDIPFKVYEGAAVNADAGSFTVSAPVETILTYTPTAASIAADTGSIAVTGTAASLEVGYAVDAATTAVSITGTAASLEVGYALDCVAGSVSVSAPNETILTYAAGTSIAADAGSVAVTGTAANLEHGTIMAAVTGAVTVSDPVDARLKLTKSGDVGTVVITGTAATLIAPSDPLIAADTGAFTVTGTAATLIAPTTSIAADAGSVAVTGTAVQFDLVRSGDVGAFTITGTAASLQYGNILAAVTGTITVTGAAASLEQGYALDCTTGSVAVTGTAAALNAGDPSLAAVTGSVSVTGTAASLERGYALDCATGSVAVTGTAAALEIGSGADFVTGSFLINGTAVAFSRTHIMPAAIGAYVLTGTAASLLKADSAGWVEQTTGAETWTEQTTGAETWAEQTVGAATWTEQ